MKTVTFTAHLAAALATIIATISGEGTGERYEITSATDESGRAVRLTSEDLDTLEEMMERRQFIVLREYVVTETICTDVMTGAAARFIVEHTAGTIHAIRYSDQIPVPKSSPQFTETAEAFHIDREWQMMQDAVDVAYAKY